MIEDLVPNDAAHLKALLVADRVDDHVAVNADEVLAVQDSVLILTRGIDHLDGKVLILVPDHFAKSVLDGGVVRVDEVAVDILHSERAFACGIVVVSEGRRSRRCTPCSAYRLIYCRRWPSCAASVAGA
nr:hypothetical protein CFP56_75713 [Quercus suber]